MVAGQVVGWFHGRMEFGPRALGARSIIGDARNEAMQATMNLRIKFRESFRPFAPCVLEEDVSRYFELDRPSPYMLLVADVRKELRRELTPEQVRLMKDPDLRKRVNVPRSSLPAITHVDMSARVQTVDEARHGRYYRLMKEFKRQTGCGVIINTSFNIRGEPIVCTPQDAYRCFLASDMDVLVLENCLLRRSEQPALSADGTPEIYRQLQARLTPPHMVNPFKEVNWNPGPRERRKFALSLIIGFPCIAAGAAGARLAAGQRLEFPAGRDRLAAAGWRSGCSCWRCRRSPGRSTWPGILSLAASARWWAIWPWASCSSCW